MKEKILIKIDVSKIDKSKIQTRTFKNRAGEQITVKEMALEVVPLREERLVKDFGNRKLLKTHFICETQTPEERAQRQKSKIVGDGLVFRNAQVPDEFLDVMPTKDISADDVDF